MKSKATGCGSISTVISSIVLLCVSSIIIIIVIIIIIMVRAGQVELPTEKGSHPKLGSLTLDLQIFL